MYVLPFNEYSIYEQEHDALSINKNYGDVLVRFIITYDDGEEKYLGRKLEDLTFGKNNKEKFINKLRDLKEYVMTKNLYSEVSKLMYKIKLYHSGISNDNELYQSVETYLCCGMYLLLVEDSIKTGQFTFKNEYTEFNKFIIDNFYEFRKHKKKKITELPKRLREQISKTGYDDNKLVPVMYFTFLTNMFMFYDVLYKKSIVKLFANYYNRKELMIDAIFRTHLSMSSIYESAYNVMKDGYGLGVEKINRLLMERSEIFNNVYIKTKAGNTYLFNEIVKEGRRVLFVYGKHKEYGGYFVEMDLLSMNKYAVKAYSYPLDKHLKQMHDYISICVAEIMLSYFYFSPSFEDAIAGSNIKNNTVFATILEQEYGSRKLNLENMDLEVRLIQPILRKLPVGQKVSEQAVENAKNEGFIIPKGYTFVSSFERDTYVKKSN